MLSFSSDDVVTCSSYLFLSNPSHLDRRCRYALRHVTPLSTYISRSCLDADPIPSHHTPFLSTIILLWPQCPHSVTYHFYFLVVYYLAVLAPIFVHHQALIPPCYPHPRLPSAVFNSNTPCLPELSPYCISPLCLFSTATILPAHPCHFLKTLLSLFLAGAPFLHCTCDYLD